MKKCRDSHSSIKFCHTFAFRVMECLVYVRIFVRFYKYFCSKVKSLYEHMCIKNK